MTPRPYFVLSLVALSVVCTAQRQHHRGNSEEGVPKALRRLLENADHQRYSGVRSVEFRFGDKSGKHDEIVIRLGKNSRVEFPAGSKLAGQIIVETEESRRHFFPDKNEVHILPPRREAAMEHLQSFVHDAAKWKFATVKGELIAGRRTVQVSVSDLQDNVVQRLWIDPWTGLLLKRQLFDGVGASAASFEFTEINLNPQIDDRTFFFDPRGAKIITPAIQLERNAKLAKFDVWSLDLNSGYRLESSRFANNDSKPLLIQHFVNKIGRLTLFQFDSAVSVDGDIVRKMARGDFQSHKWTNGKWTFVLVGSMDKSVLERLSRHVIPGTGEASD